MKRSFYVIALLALSLQMIRAEERKPDAVVRDSVELGEIIVTGSRPAVNLNNLPMSVSVVGSKQIEAKFEQSLLPIITEEVPSLFVTSRGIMGYGVSTGAAGGMTIRGIGGSPTAQMLMLIDGHPQYMGLMGHPLADSYQSLMAERVEVVRGPASVLYGSNAMGGVINIITKKQKEDGIRTGVRAMYGSYNTLSTELNNAVRSGKFNSYVSLSYNRSDNHRDNMDFEQYSGYGKVGYDFSPNWNAFVDLDLTNFKASNPGTTSAPLLDNDADIIRGVTSFSLENNYEKTSGALKVYYNFGKHKINDGYSAVNPEAVPRNERFRSTDKMIGITLYQSYSFFTGNQTTAGIDFQHFGGHAWNIFMDGQADKDIAKKSLNEVAGYLNFQQTLISQLVLNAGIRIDHHAVTGTEWIPQLGLSYIATDNTILKGIVSKGFRNPTIREMYMFPPQNPDLKPEELMNYELSASHKMLDKSLTFDLSLYYINGKNSIQTVPVDGKPLNINTGKIKNYGVEFATQYKLNPYISLSANYSWLHMKYKVVASPEHKLYAGINYTRNKWNLSTGIQYINDLYSSVKTNTTEEIKDSFALWNVRGSYKPVKQLEIFVKGENLLAQKYEINAGYPMPRATVFGGVNLRF
ncbi:outer membrane receptor protein involved in Fe transport [Dysgonomonas sp. PFB1-18]|uniref:TonB-dependent receptor plug domain-containing protein n=1 Tax=unclassified Dysgonomonas TaxID=2630389 RepID=UPI002475B394|nr:MULTISPECIES: TonB-dependent receptor [unclassified Dysgonomonas]MDH6308611.1 outer membrane receptor protein involved in Fe transport [Dysgonomonas sp. PF1-14]MDH6338112.1 outer membrane receptor protein involved in Fe transport [Dysgonomonas sp. PF1-16]MDH6379609.1 outer membrane receptor protein involved in Fe transport [Dysgonomonas sp. PFB1-18]MDH6396939.1 outer membrane receptor protein involved in Fe transport [Dysgonomonas sp. PF1-23]